MHNFYNLWSVTFVLLNWSVTVVLYVNSFRETPSSSASESTPKRCKVEIPSKVRVSVHIAAKFSFVTRSIMVFPLCV